MAITIKTNRTDINAKIDSIDKAKNYGNYNGKPLTNDSDKEIFDDPKLKEKKPDGSVGDNPNLVKLCDTVELLSACEEAKETVKTETMGLTENRHALMLILLQSQKANSDSYQLINGGIRNGQIDKVISQFEDVLFAESEPEFFWKEEKAALKIKNLGDERKAIDEKIKKLEKKYNQKLLDEQGALEHKIAYAVTALQADLKHVGVGGRRFFEAAVASSDATSKRKYKSTTPAIPGVSYGSIIKTGYTKNSKPNTHPMYLLSDLPGQI